MRGFREALSNANVLCGFKIQRNSGAFGKECHRDFKGCAKHTSARIEYNNSSSEVCEASPLKSPTRRSQMTHPLTPSAREGEVLDSLGVAQTHGLLQSKSKQKTLDLGDSRESCEISPTANSKSCAGISDSHKTCEVLPTLIFQSCAGISDSRESKRFSPTFLQKSRLVWATPINSLTSPSPCGRGLGGGVKNHKDSHKSNESQKIFRLYPQNDKMQNSRESKNFFAYFFLKKVSGRQPKLKIKLPPPFGRGLGGGVNPKNNESLHDSRKYQKLKDLCESKEILRLSPQNDKMQDLRESQNLDKSKTPIIPHKFTTLALHKPNLRIA